MKSFINVYDSFDMYTIPIYEIIRNSVNCLQVFYLLLVLRFVHQNLSVNPLFYFHTGSSLKDYHAS